MLVQVRSGEVRMRIGVVACAGILGDLLLTYGCTNTEISPDSRIAAQPEGGRERSP